MQTSMRCLVMGNCSIVDIISHSAGGRTHQTAHASRSVTHVAMDQGRSVLRLTSVLHECDQAHWSTSTGTCPDCSLLGLPSAHPRASAPEWLAAQCRSTAPCQCQSALQQLIMFLVLLQYVRTAPGRCSCSQPAALNNPSSSSILAPEPSCIETLPCPPGSISWILLWWPSSTSPAMVVHSWPCRSCSIMVKLRHCRYFFALPC
jgi:hypothetical protein